jgi:hypothetical protein
MTANRITPVALVAVLLSAPLAAQLPVESTPVPAPLTAPSSQRDAQAGDVGADLGTGWNILQIPAAAFVPGRSEMAYLRDALGYLVSETPGDSFWAPVTLPTGASIGFLGLYANDTANQHIRAILVRFLGWGCTWSFGLCQLPVPPTLSYVAFVDSLGSAGYQYTSTAVIPPHTVNNYVFQNGAQYVVQVVGHNPTWSFRGVDIWWKRQISPAPSAARFTDVPMNAQFFAEVEALAASGITAGCTATTFCPEAPLTRRQMAAPCPRARALLAVLNAVARAMRRMANASGREGSYEALWTLRVIDGTCAERANSMSPFSALVCAGA